MRMSGPSAGCTTTAARRWSDGSEARSAVRVVKKARKAGEVVVAKARAREVARRERVVGERGGRREVMWWRSSTGRVGRVGGGIVGVGWGVGGMVWFEGCWLVFGSVRVCRVGLVGWPAI